MQNQQTLDKLKYSYYYPLYILFLFNTGIYNILTQIILTLAYFICIQPNPAIGAWGVWFIYVNNQIHTTELSAFLYMELFYNIFKLDCIFYSPSRVAYNS